MKKIWIITLFPEYFEPLTKFGIIGQALRGERGNSPELHFVQLRDFSNKDYKGVDDTPFGGGPGMVMRPDVLRRALFEGVVKNGNYSSVDELEVIYTGPRGKVWNNVECKSISKLNKDILSKKSGEIINIDNKEINMLARILGCPESKSSGIYIHRNSGIVKKDEKLMTFYSESDVKLKEAIDFIKEKNPFVIR